MNELIQLLAGLKKQRPANGFDPQYLADETIDPSVRADAGLGSMQGEVRNRLFQAERTQAPRGSQWESPNSTNPFEVVALRNMLTGIGRERDASPLVAQGQEVAGQRQQELESINQGFTGQQAIEQSTSGRLSGAAENPIQQREIYKRQHVERNSPATLQAGRIADEQFRQGRQLNANNRQTMAQMAPSMMDAETRQKYNEALLSGRLDSLGNYKGMNRYGPQFQPVPQINPNQLNNNVQKEFGYVQPGSDPFDGFGTPGVANPALEQSIRTAVTASGMDIRSQNTFYELMSDPEDRQLSVEELVSKYDFDTRDADWPKLAQLLLQFRGK